ncbi:MAG: hypothetical protein FD126_2679 [Elusimicrobia bacterium]|nr:MAG: hypothetical protein FD126_2679 [Elusimicrobiota bacterium]
MTPRLRRLLALFLGGSNLFVLQFLATRNLAEILFGTETVLFLVVLSYFLGLSLGYRVSNRLGPRTFRALLWAQWAFHLTLPYSLRWLAGWLRFNDAAGWAVVGPLFFGGFLASTLYSVVLPRLLAETGTDERDFSRSYALELSGGAFGMLATVLVGTISPPALAGLYQASLAALVLLVNPGRFAAAVIVPIASAALVFAPALDAQSVAYNFRAGHGYDVSKVVFSADTPYQRVSIIEEEDGTRHLFLDGIRHYGSDSLTEFNYLTSGFPASQLDKPRTVVVGSGSFEAAYRALARGGLVTSVEIDPVVAQAGLHLLSKPLPTEPALRWDIVADDAKHYIAHMQERPDLVVLDVAGPFQRQVTLLYTKEFLTILKGKLAPGGLLSLPLNGDLDGDSRAACRIARTLLEVFPDVYVLTRPKGDSSFAIASAGRPGWKPRLAAELFNNKRGDIKVYERSQVEDKTDRPGCRAIRLDSLDIVWDRGWTRLRDKIWDR